MAEHLILELSIMFVIFVASAFLGAVCFCIHYMFHSRLIFPINPYLDDYIGYAHKQFMSYWAGYSLLIFNLFLWLHVAGLYRAEGLL